MSEPLLRTKLYAPILRFPNLVPRPILIERLDEGLRHGRKLTLISAPAGCGKTTLAAAWLAHLTEAAPLEDSIPNPQSPIRNRTAWLSLDEADSDPTRFLTTLIAALQTIQPDLGESALAMLRSAQAPPPAPILTVLLNEIASAADPIILVLDDYHRVDMPAGDSVLAPLVEHLPPAMHLVITTREDPDLPLHRLRGRGQLSEVRAADLRFTHAEAAQFLNQVMGLALSEEAIAALERRTEGWITGLQMAALALQGRSMHGEEDTAAFIRAFTGSHRFVLDYLVEEVLQSQSAEVREFLLQTSILNRLCGPLCARVHGGEAYNGQEILEALERGNLFIIPLDDERRWYRYHHLFTQVLQARLLEEMPDRLAELQRRASAWYEENDYLADAVPHALAAGDYESAAGLIERARPEMEGNYLSAAWLDWVQELPPELVSSRPVLSAGYGWALLDVGELEAGEPYLRDAERWLEKISTSGERDPEVVVVDEEQFRSLGASIAAAHAYHALALGNVPDTLKYAQQALDKSPEGEFRWRLAAASLLGIAHYTSGALEEAQQALGGLMADMQRAGSHAEAISLAFVLADITIVQGRLQEAEDIYEKSLKLATGHDGAPLLGSSDQYRGLAEIFLERNDLQTAAQHLQTAAKLGEQSSLTNWPYRLLIARARLKQAEGDLDGALALLDEAQDLDIRTPVPVPYPAAALQARMRLARGETAAALAWARQAGLSAGDAPAYMREFDHLTLARALIARGRDERSPDAGSEAVELLERLLQAARDGERGGREIESQMLLALAHQAQGSMPAALDYLARALTLAEPEGYTRLFLDEGEPMAELLRQAAAQGISPNYTQHLLSSLSFAKSATHNPKSTIVEPLSRRERDVLRLLATELSGPQIADELMVSLNTMRTHTKNIYSKLGVNNRRSAVRRARELDLL